MAGNAASSTARQRFVTVPVVASGPSAAGRSQGQSTAGISDNLRRLENKHHDDVLHGLRKVVEGSWGIARKAFVSVGNLFSCCLHSSGSSAVQRPDAGQAQPLLTEMRESVWNALGRTSDRIMLLSQGGLFPVEEWRATIHTLALCLDSFSWRDEFGMGASAESREEFGRLMRQPVIGRMTLTEIEEKLSAGENMLRFAHNRLQLLEYLGCAKAALMRHAVESGDERRQAATANLFPNAKSLAALVSSAGMRDCSPAMVTAI